LTADLFLRLASYLYAFSTYLIACSVRTYLSITLKPVMPPRFSFRTIRNLLSDHNTFPVDLNRTVLQRSELS